MNPTSAADELGIAVTRGEDGADDIALSGRWTLATLGGKGPALAARLHRPDSQSVRWDCQGISAIDSAGAVLLWQTWGRRLPGQLVMRPEHRNLFERLAAVDALGDDAGAQADGWQWLIDIGLMGQGFFRHLVDFMATLGAVTLAGLSIVRRPSLLPAREISANLFKSGVRAMPVTALVGFLIGVVLSYLSALQLRQFGADAYIVDLLGMGIIRELGPVLVAVLVAGRSGSAMTAQLGVMRVTEEIDALSAMGVSRDLRLLLPKVVALAVAMPMLVLWASAIALMGGMVAAQIELDVSYRFFIAELPKSVPVANVWIALAKGWVFGAVVALVSCHFGLRVRPNTESLSANTTASVVASITLVILLDAVFAIATRDVGLPG
jgi:phospholipid/cholesterol/gamma-HCH transport system permease protein